MRTLTCMVLAVLSLQYGQLVSGTDEWTYSYTANISIRHRVSDEFLSEWLLSGKLIIHNYSTYKTMKLIDMKTIGYHGPNSDSLELLHAAVPNASDILAQQFVAHYSLDKLEAVSFMQDEPVWSKNMKKAIASLYQADLSAIHEVENLYEEEDIMEEKNIFGSCALSYEFPDPNDESTFIKHINTRDCKMFKKHRPLWRDARYGSVVGTSDRKYTYANRETVKDSRIQFVNVESTATFTYKMSSASPDKYFISQKQYLKLIDTSPINEKIDISEVTNRQDPYYQSEEKVEKEEEGEKDSSLITKWQSVYADLNKSLVLEKSESTNGQNYDRLEKLHKIMASMNVNTLDTFRDAEYSHDDDMVNIFVSLLPTLGTSNSVKFIKHLIKNEAIIHFSGLRTVASYPFYLKTVNVELIKDMEEFLDLDKIQSELVKQAYILSFSNLVGSLNKHIDYDKPNLVYKRIIEEYVEKYYNFYTETDDYNLRMQYVLGMMNMGPLATYKLLSIVGNTTESVHIRILATNAIRQHNHLERPEPFQRFWPIVLDRRADYELRVAALGVLLEAPSMEPSEIFSIFRYMNQTSDDPVEQHLFNYFYTTMKSVRPNWEGAKARSEPLVETIVSKLKRPASTKAILTGNYYEGYKNGFGTALDRTIVVIPGTNFVTSMHVSINNYLDYQRLDSYSFYLKVAGGLFYKKAFREWSGVQYPVKDLYKILHMAKVALKEAPTNHLRIEFVIFCEKRAVFSLYVEDMRKNANLLEVFVHELIEYIVNSDIVTTNTAAHYNFVSDLGTPLSVAIRHELGYRARSSVFSRMIENKEMMYVTARHTWTSVTDIKSVNPLTNINHGLIDIYSNKKYLKWKSIYDDSDRSLKWKDEDVYYDNLLEKKPALYIESGKDMDEYCPKCIDIQFLNGKQPANMNHTFRSSLRNIVHNITYYPLDGLVTQGQWNLYSEAEVPPTSFLFWYQYNADYFYYNTNWDVSTTRLAFEPTSSEPSEFSLTYGFDVKREHKKNKHDVSFEIELDLKQTKLSDNQMLNYHKLNISTRATETGLYMKLHLANNEKSTYDVHTQLDYAPVVKSKDRFSLAVAEPLTSKTSIHYKDETDSTIVDITTSFHVSEEQQLRVKESNDYKQCQVDAGKGAPLRHAAPSNACYRSSMGMSTYDVYAIDADVKDFSELFLDLKSVLQPMLIPLHQSDLRDFNVSALYTASDSTLTSSVTKSSSMKIDKAFRPQMLLKSKEKLYDEIMHDRYGAKSYCIITPYKVKTFMEQTVLYDMATTMISLIECNNNSRVGLLTRRSYDTVDFKLWLDDNTFVVEMNDNGGYAVNINDKLIEESFYDETISVEFLAENTLYISTNRLEVFYNQDYVSVKINTAAISGLCGICSTGILTAPNMITYRTNFE